MREKHLAVHNFRTKISDDDQKNIFRTQRRRVAKINFEHGKNEKNENAPCGA